MQNCTNGYKQVHWNTNMVPSVTSLVTSPENQLSFCMQTFPCSETAACMVLSRKSLSSLLQQVLSQNQSPFHFISLTLWCILDLTKRRNDCPILPENLKYSCVLATLGSAARRHFSWKLDSSTTTTKTHEGWTTVLRQNHIAASSREPSRTMHSERQQSYNSSTKHVAPLPKCNNPLHAYVTKQTANQNQV